MAALHRATPAPIGLVFLLGLAASSADGPAPDAPRLPSYKDHDRLLVVRDASGKESPVKDVSDWNVRKAHVLGWLQEVTGPLPGGERRCLLDVEELEQVNESKYVRKHIRYRSEPADRVPAWLLIPKERAGRAPAMLCLHQTTAIGKDEPVGLGGKPNLRYARELAERGYVVLAPDYPNFDEHKVDVYELGYASASMKAIWDNMRGVDLLAAMPEVDPTRIGVIGHSLGGHNAIFTAVFDERLRAVVSSCGFNSFPFYYKGDLTGWSHRGYMPRIKERYDADPGRVPFDFPELLGALAPRGFFTSSPLHDENFEVEGVRRCVDSAREVYRLHHAEDRLRAAYPDARHDFPPEQRREAYEFLDRVLKP